MAIRGLRFGMLASALAIALTATAIAPATGSPVPLAPLVDYPTWDQVQAARGSQAATAETIAALDTLLARLQSDSARLGDEAVERAAESDAAQSKLDAATESATDLARQADAATRKAQVSTEQAAAVVATLYRSGGTDLDATMLLADSDTSSDLLYRLGALDKLGAHLDLVLQHAQADRNQAQAIGAQAAVAASERARLASTAKSALASAQTALDAANAAVASQQADLDELYAQLASLKNTTVQIEQAYAIGQQQSNQGSGGPPGGDSAGGGSPGGGAVGSDNGYYVTDIPSSADNNPAAAQAFAWATLASYGFGQEQNSCLLWLWNRESNWRTNAYNPYGPAYGIPQALPGSKMSAVGADWRTNYRTQVTWGILYIIDRYDTPCGAWAHSERVGWY